VYGRWPGLWALVAVLAASANARAREVDLAVVVRKAEQRTSQRLLELARAAERDDLAAAALALYGAALEFDPDGLLVRTKLGYRRARGAWVRDPATEEELAARVDADPAAGKERIAVIPGIREEHLAEVIRLCVKYGTLEARRPVLEPLLARMPRRADLHEALGHVRIGDNWVRPELVEVVKMMLFRLQAWHNFARAPLAPEPSDFALRVPGLTEPPAFRRAAGCEVATTLEEDVAVATAVARTQALLHFMLGEDAATWKPPAVLFLGAKPYAAMVRALHADEDAFRLYSRFDNYEHRDFYAIRVYAVGDAEERYAHAAGYLTMFQLAAPDARGSEGGRDTHAYAWLLEGYGYLLGLELFDRANISFVSLEETGKKQSFTRPPPAAKTRASCVAWLREQMLAGRSYPLRAVCAKSLNNLDFCASMEAYSFLRFLFLYDAAAAKRLPAALRRRTEGPPADRVAAALRELFGKGFAELEPIWRTFVLEIDDE